MSDESKHPLVLEFNRKLKAALELTRSKFERESKHIHDIVFPGYNLKLGQNVLLIRDVDDSQRSKSITGRDLKLLSLGAKDYYIGALFERMRLHIRECFWPVAQVAATLIASGSVFFHEEAVFAAAFYITDCADWVGGIYEYLGLSQPALPSSRTGANAIIAAAVTEKVRAAARRKVRRRDRAIAAFWAAAKARNRTDFEFGFHSVFVDEWRGLLWKAQLEHEAPSQASTPSQMIHDDARSRVQPSESAGTVDQRTQQIGDRVVSYLPQRSGAPAQQADQGGSQANIVPLLTIPWKRFIAEIMIDHPDYPYKQICDAADRRRRKREEGETKKEIAPPVSWMKASGETRPPEEYLLDDALWARVYDADNSRHKLEVEFSKIRKKAGLKNLKTRRAA